LISKKLFVVVQCRGDDSIQMELRRTSTATVR